MNPIQKIIILTVALFVVIMLLYPPFYDGQLHFINSHPQAWIGPKQGEADWYRYGGGHYQTVSINHFIWHIQFVIVAVIGTALFVVCKSKK
jgi:hypothetical protein